MHVTSSFTPGDEVMVMILTEWWQASFVCAVLGRQYWGPSLKMQAGEGRAWMQQTGSTGSIGLYQALQP